ncbi:hypothetical protein PoB_004234000 [Plakobranchus ocellatus]|uniref:Uncharacterized protein n=1 Tax=Plakobranchus ocellatus TaxID=259542 RepID=A0AAV4B5H9_9GAST|nr:hypothetical protein PoB_004234000 [Plakobranchus ocellatus]
MVVVVVEQEEVVVVVVVMVVEEELVVVVVVVEEEALVAQRIANPPLDLKGTFCGGFEPHRQCHGLTEDLKA